MDAEKTPEPSGRSANLGASTVALVFVLVGLMVVASVRVGGPSAGPSVPGLDVVYVTQSANLRRCPTTSCEVVVKSAPRNSQLVVVRHVQGASVSGSKDWLEVDTGSATAFVHSSVVSEPGGLPWQWFELVVTLALTAAAVALGLVGRSNRIARLVAETDETHRDIGLYGVVVTGGVVAGCVGFALAQADGQSLLSFWSSAFVNFGAGLVGAGVAFIVFQRITRNSPSPISRLQLEIAQLRVVVEKLASDRPTPSDERDTKQSRWCPFLCTIFGGRDRRDRP